MYTISAKCTHLLYLGMTCRRFPFKQDNMSNSHDELKSKRLESCRTAEEQRGCGMSWPDMGYMRLRAMTSAFSVPSSAALPRAISWQLRN